MGKRQVFVTQAELTRYLKAYRDAGIPIARSEIDPRTGRVVIYSSDAASDSSHNPWDEA